MERIEQLNQFYRVLVFFTDLSKQIDEVPAISSRTIFMGDPCTSFVLEKEQLLQNKRQKNKDYLNNPIAEYWLNSVGMTSELNNLTKLHSMIKKCGPDRLQETHQKILEFPLKGNVAAFEAVEQLRESIKSFNIALNPEEESTDRYLMNIMHL